MGNDDAKVPESKVEKKAKPVKTEKTTEKSNLKKDTRAEFKKDYYKNTKKGG